MIQQSSIVESAEWPPALKSSRLDCLESRQGLGLEAAQALPAYTEFEGGRDYTSTSRRKPALVVKIYTAEYKISREDIVSVQ